MTDSSGTQSDLPQPVPLGKITRAVLRALASTAALVVVYYLLPLDHSTPWLAITMLAIGLVALISPVAYQVRGHHRLSVPGAAGGGGPGHQRSAVPAAVRGHLRRPSRPAHGSFNQPMNHTNALYFTVTVFATVGFGDITAQTATARLLVTGQMITDLIILGLGARVIVGAVTRGRQRLPQDAGTAPPGKDPA